MRPIKFRAWDGVVMHYDVTMMKDWGAIKDGYAGTAWSNNAKAGEPMQFTGLSDKNGVDIYESDLIEVWDWGSQPETQKLLGVTSVVWDLDDCGWRYDDTALTDDFYDQSRRVKVIGNIWANPELLTGAKNGD